MPNILMAFLAGLSFIFSFTEAKYVGYILCSFVGGIALEKILTNKEHNRLLKRHFPGKY